MDLDYSAPRVQWLHTLLRRKAEAQGARPSKPEKKGTCLSVDNFCQIRARCWTPSCVCYMSRALLKVRGCRQGHRGHA